MNWNIQIPLNLVFSTTLHNRYNINDAGYYQMIC